MTSLRWLIGIVASIGFVASLLVHVSALLGIDVQAQLPGVWLLHVGIFLVFFPLVLFSRRELGEQPFSKLYASLPRWVSVLGIAIFVYALVNFALFLVATEGGSPAIRGGDYFLLDHGRVIREITAAEYSAFRANEVRGFSGHWLLFYFWSAAYFLGWKPNGSTQPSR